MTPYLDVQNLTKSFGALVLFENISFGISEGQRVGLIAKNGTGKSTLLSVLTGREGYDSGSIIYRKDLKIGFLEQAPRFSPDDTVLDACFNHEGEEEKVLEAIEKEKTEHEMEGENVVVLTFGQEGALSAAHELFAMLRSADRENADLILAAALPQKGVGFSVMNRMLKSAGFNRRKV